VDSDDAAYLILGLTFSLLGYLMMGQGGYVDWRFGYIDFGPYHYLIGMFVLCVGVIMILAILGKYLRR
jgi:hypothetical protein